LVALPIAWYEAGQWLSNYAYRINIPWWIFGSAFLGTIGVTLLLITVLGLKTIRTSATETLRSE
jgi:putative ABC transport system permease protein